MSLPPGTTPAGAEAPAGTSRISVGPDWLQEFNFPAGQDIWQFTQNELLGVDDFRNFRHHLGEGNLGRAAISGATGLFELGLTGGALLSAIPTGGASLAGRAALAGGRAATVAGITNPGVRAATRTALRRAATPFRSRGRVPVRQSVQQGLRFGVGGGFDRYGNPVDPVAAADEEEAEAEDTARIPIDWASIFDQFAGDDAGGVSVPTGLFNLYETPMEQEMLARELADLEARRVAGERALLEGWGEVQSVNSAAAEKARGMVAGAGDAGAAIWTDAADRSRELADAIAVEAGGFDGRAAIDIGTGGVDQWAGFMESQAPAQRAFAEGQQTILADDAQWMADLAASQGQAYAGDLNRQANFLAFDRAREHNMRVQDRIDGERMMLAQMQMQADATNAQLGAGGGAADKFMEDAMLAATMGQPGMLVAMYPGLTPEQASQIVNDLMLGLGEMATIG